MGPTHYSCRDYWSCEGLFVAVCIRLSVLILLGQAAFLVAATEPPKTYTIQTVAGTDSVGDGGPALAALFSQAEGVAVDKLGNIYVADADDNRVRKITAGRHDPDRGRHRNRGTGGRRRSGNHSALESSLWRCGGRERQSLYRGPGERARAQGRGRWHDSKLSPAEGPSFRAATATAALRPWRSFCNRATSRSAPTARSTSPTSARTASTRCRRPVF